MSTSATLEPRTRQLDRPALELRGVVKRFGGVAAVDGINLELAPGEPLAVIGPNGAGKSTLLRLIAGELKPDEGTIAVDGRDHDGAAAHRIARRGIGLAHQVPLPFRKLTVRENVQVGALNHRHRQSDGADSILVRCGIEHLADRPAGSLGLLDLKRLELARALSLQPSVLLLDEVAAGLAGRDLEAIIALVAEIRDDGVTLVIVEHVERVVRELVERVVVLDWGRVIAEGTSAEIAADDTVREVYLGTGSVDEPTRHKRSPSTAGPLAGSPAGLALNLAAVTAGYGSVTALRELDLEVAPGEAVAVLGANGAGKSTLARVISGLTPARSGSISVDGEDITSVSAHARVELGIAHCQEGRRLFGGMTVEENLMLPTRSRRAREGLAARRAWVQELFPVLADRSDQEAQSLSGGQQQMVAIARALMANPRLVVFDEISLGLAPAAIDVLYGAIDRISEAGISILLVEQNVHRGLAFADRAYVLDRGMVAFFGDPSELLDEERLDAAYFGAGRERSEAPVSGGQQ